MNTIIFDFDGTIADSFDTVLAITNRLAQEYGYKPASPDEIKSLQNLSSREIIRKSNIPLYKVPYLLQRLKLEMSHEIVHLKPFPGIREALVQLQQAGYPLGIVTSNTSENVKFFLEQHQMQELFSFVRSGVALFGKARIINQLLKEHPLARESIIYVGDETRDVEAAHKTHIKVVAVGWGFNSSQALIEANPHALVLKPEELVGAIARLARVEDRG